MKKRILWIVAALLLISFALWGPIVSNVEQARYTVIETYGEIEIRDYAPMIVAETEVAGERKDAIGQGFRVIADYIFGNNRQSNKVAMTAPVMQQPSEKIAMTAPVMQMAENSAWKIRFVMPSSYTMATLPTPNNDKVRLRELPGKRFAVIQFSGTASQSNLKEHSELLAYFINRQNLAVLSEPTFSFFNPPWTLPFLRRNEVMVEISK